ncbi:MAG: arylsulfatase [Acidobacteriota bacterium]
MAASAFAAAGKKTNIVMVVLDDAGYGDFGCFGQELIQTPHIDRLAAQGTRYMDFYCGAPVCAPSRCVLMTGLHGGHAAIRANAGTVSIRDEDLTLAEILRKAGYRTGGFGKWGLGDAATPGAPTRQGFDEFFGYLHQVHAHSYYPEFLWDNEKRMDLHGQYSADLIAERSFQFLEKAKSVPFFLYACYTLPHAKFEGPDMGAYAGRDWPEAARHYAAMTTRADRYVGRLLELLKQNGLESDTLVLVTSDNGAHSGMDKGYELFRSNGVLRGEKGMVYEGGIRVPCVVRWPGHVKAGGVSNTPWGFVDMVPTLSEVAGATPPTGLDGVSMVPHLMGGPAPKRPVMYWEQNIFNMQQQRWNPAGHSRALRDGRWKAVRVKDGPVELYDLAADKSERNNLAAKEPALATKYGEWLDKARTEPRSHAGASMKFREKWSDN